MMRGGEFNKPVHIINMEIKDNHEEALIAGKAMIDLAEAVSFSYSDPGLTRLTTIFQIENAEDIDENIDNILEVQQEKHPHSLLHAVAFYQKPDNRGMKVSVDVQYTPLLELSTRTVQARNVDARDSESQSA